jgi:hypothetical protein
MSPMTMIKSSTATGNPILTNHNDEEFGEEIVELFIAHANALRKARGQSALSVGALESASFSGHDPRGGITAIPLKETGFEKQPIRRPC